MVPDEKSNAMQVGAAPVGSPTLLPNVESQHSEWGCLRYRSRKQLASMPGDFGKRARWRCGRSRLVYSSEHRCDGTRTPLVIAAPIVSPELEDISMVPTSGRRTGR